MRRFATTTAVLAFMMLALIAFASGVPVLYCALRALGGAVAVYLVASVAGRMLLNIFVDAIITHVTSDPKAGEIDRDNAG